jgi:hypothetical protein
MSATARNAHKAKQAAHKQFKRKKKIILLLNKYPRGYATTYRKTKTHNKRIKSIVDTAVVKKNFKALIRAGKKRQSADEVYV